MLPLLEVIRASELVSTETAADTGAGTGCLSLPLAHAAGSGGKVYAVDAQEKMLPVETCRLNCGLER